MSASITPTDRPSAARATARLAVTDDLPTPPLPDATANTLVIDPGCENGMTGSPAPPRSFERSDERCSGVITPSSTSTPDTPSTAVAAAVTSLTSVDFIGQPATVRSTPTATCPPSATSTDRTMPRSVMGRRISGSSTPVSASRTRASSVGESTAVMRRS
jgi:hypothetical protein